MARKKRRDAPANPLRLLFRAELVGQPHGLAWSPDGRHVAVARHEALEVVSPDARVSKSYAFTDGAEHVFCAAWNPDARSLIAGTGAGRLIEADLHGGWRARDPHWFDRVEDLAVHPRGDRLAAVHELGSRLSVFDLGRDCRMWSLEGHRFGRPAWSPDGGRLAVTRYEDEIEDFLLLILDARDGEVATSSWARRPDIVPVWIDHASLYAGDARYGRLERQPPDAQPLVRDFLEMRRSTSEGATSWSRAGLLATVRETDAGDALQVHDALHLRRGCEAPRLGRIIETAWNVQGNRLAVLREGRHETFRIDVYEHAGAPPLPPPDGPDPRYADGFPTDPRDE